MNESARKLPRYPGCFVCGPDNVAGLNLDFFADGETVFTETVLDRRFAGWENHVHGGIISALLDETLTWAAIVATRQMFYTAELRVRFLKPLDPDERIRVTAHTLSVRRKLVVAGAQIETARGEIVATAESRHLPIPPERLNGMDRIPQI